MARRTHIVELVETLAKSQLDQTFGNLRLPSSVNPTIKLMYVKLKILAQNLKYVLPNNPIHNSSSYKSVSYSIYGV